MYISLHESLTPASGADISIFAMEFDGLLVGHYRKHLLLTLTPAEALAIEAAVALGAMAKAALATIKRKAPEYASAVKHSRRRIVLCADNVVVGTFQIEPSGDVLLPLRMFHQHRSAYHPQLFVEHAINDRNAIEMVFLSFCDLRNMPSNLVAIRACHGGGTSIGDVLRNQPPGGSIGVCVCDRDKPPFTADRLFANGSTADQAHRAALELHLIEEGEFGWSTRDPFFAFQLTHPHTVEGYVGPHLLEAFFSANAQLAEVRNGFLAAFPRFPNLGEEEMAVWFSLNLKDGSCSSEELLAAMSVLDIDIGDLSVDMPRALALAIPRNTITWLHENLQIGRFKAALRAAFRKDVESALYAASVAELTALVWDFLAADSRMGIS